MSLAWWMRSQVGVPGQSAGWCGGQLSVSTADGHLRFQLQEQGDGPPRHKQHYITLQRHRKRGTLRYGRSSH